jgi:hypothetical protein
MARRRNYQRPVRRRTDPLTGQGGSMNYESGKALVPPQ